MYDGLAQSWPATSNRHRNWTLASRRPWTPTRKLPTSSRVCDNGCTEGCTELVVVEPSTGEWLLNGCQC